MIRADTGLNIIQLTFRQRWNHYLTLAFAVVAIIIGLSLRDSAIYAVKPYVNSLVGISALYPQNWLIDTEGEYVFRVQDMSRIGFKTTIQVSVQAVNPNTAIRNIVDALTLKRAQTLAAYKPLPTNNAFVLSDGGTASEIKYAYTSITADPFLDTPPIVVRGVDIVSIKRGQAVIVTFLADTNSYDQEYVTFSRFLSSLEF